MLECHKIGKTYGQGVLAQTVLRDVSLSLDAGETCVVLGASGSGKTTLLSILGCLLSPSTGRVRLGGTEVDYRSQRMLIETRRKHVGFVFQNAQLLPFLCVGDNLRVVAENSGVPPHILDNRVGEVCTRLGIDDIRRKKPGQLSGGQRQRAAIARAVLHRPALILADEPTAALDWENGQEAVRLLLEQARFERALLITVTHDVRLTRMFDRVMHMNSGYLQEQ